MNICFCLVFVYITLTKYSIGFICEIAKRKRKFSFVEREQREIKRKKRREDVILVNH